MSEFEGEAGTIYVKKSKDCDERPYEVWLEDFCILGTGDSILAALENAAKQTALIQELIASAVGQVSTTAGTGD